MQLSQQPVQRRLEADALAGLYINCLGQLQNGLDKQLGGGQAGGCSCRFRQLLLAPVRQQLRPGGGAHSGKVALHKTRAGGTTNAGSGFGQR